MLIPTQMAWRPNLTPAELVWRAHLQLRYWRDLADVDKAAFWHSRRDELLDKVSHRDLDLIDRDLSIRLAIPGCCTKVMKVSR